MVVWRYSLVRMYYKLKPGTDTPNPFAELRIFLYSKTQLPEGQGIKLKVLMAEELNKMEWVFISMMISILRTQVFFQTVGFEEMQADNEEAIKELKFTGVKANFQEPYRYARFVKKGEFLDIPQKIDMNTIRKFLMHDWYTNDNKSKRPDYIEREIRQIERQRMEGIKRKSFTQISPGEIMVFVRQGRAYWNMITLKQYLVLRQQIWG